ncbi:protein bric-a-brac 1-like isoform X2 [Amphibalanus amphitrite]|nr:protein bric-a-brac 1-like isoform X2 [Amphibalanus amphitrite]
MADQQFCLRWNHHHTTLINVFESLLKDESLVDVTLYAEERPVRAHKVVLSACSPYFKAIFSAHTENHPVIILKDVLYSELRALVDYMYIGEVNVSQDQLASLIKSAESLKIKGLADGVSRKPPPPPPASPPASLPSLPLPNLPTTRLPPTAPPIPALASLPPLAALPPLPGLALPPPPPPFQHGRRSASPHAVPPRGSPLGRPVADQLNGRVSPPPTKRARRPSRETSPASGGSPPPAGDQPERPPSAHSSPSLPRIPATITPLATSRADSPAELDLSCRPTMKTEPAGDGRDGDEADQRPRPRSDDAGDGGDELEPAVDEDRAGPSAPLTGTPGPDVGMLNSSGYMNWQMGGGDSGGVDVPFIPTTDAGGPQDKFLSTLRHFLAGEGGGAAGGGGGGTGGSGGGNSAPPQCQRCGRLYSTRGNLRRHREYECGVEPRFSCSGCGRKFTHKHHMSSHVHSGRCSGAAWAAQDQKAASAWSGGGGAGEWRHLAESDAVVLPSTGGGGENGGAV